MRLFILSVLLLFSSGLSMPRGGSPTNRPALRKIAPGPAGNPFDYLTIG